MGACACPRASSPAKMSRSSCTCTSRLPLLRTCFFLVTMRIISVRCLSLAWGKMMCRMSCPHHSAALSPDGNHGRLPQAQDNLSCSHNIAAARVE